MRTFAPLLLLSLSACWTDSASKQTTPRQPPVATNDASKSAPPRTADLVGTADFGHSDDANIYGGLVDQDGNDGFGSGRGGVQGGVIGGGPTSGAATSGGSTSGAATSGGSTSGSTNGGSTSGSTNGGPKTAGGRVDGGDPTGGTATGSGGITFGGRGTGWGTIGTGRYGTIGHGSGTTGSGYGVGGGRGGMRGRSAVPTISIGQPVTTGGDLDKAIIRRYIKRNSMKLQYCYEKQLIAKPGIGGTVTTKFTIDADGKVSSSTAKGFGDHDVDTCIADVLHAIEFPKPKDGKPVDVAYPFTFRPAGS